MIPARSVCTVAVATMFMLVAAVVMPGSQAFGMSASRFIMKTPKDTQEKPNLILISGSPGTGKSTFAMSVALDQAILRCISTDTIRATMRSFVSPDISPALHRSSFAEAFEGDCPVRSWKETCSVLSPSVEGLIDDAMKRGTSIVVEGVHIIPTNDLIQKWEEAGGRAVGVLLQIRNDDKHKGQLRKRGVMTGAHAAEETKIAAFDRIRAIQDEMMRLAKENQWIQIEQRTAPDPLDLVGGALSGDSMFDQVVISNDEEEREEEEASIVKGHVNGSAKDFRKAEEDRTGFAAPPLYDTS